MAPFVQKFNEKKIIHETTKKGCRKKNKLPYNSPIKFTKKHGAVARRQNFLATASACILFNKQIILQNAC